MSDVTIRPTIAGDLDALATALIEVHATDGYPVEGVENARGWVELPDPIGQWTALLDGRPVGHVALIRPQIDMATLCSFEQVARKTYVMAELARLFVRPDARGRFIASELMETAEKFADFQGLTLVLEVLQKDSQAIRLYQKRGWIRIGASRHHVAGGGFALSVCMALPKTDSGP